MKRGRGVYFTTVFFTLAWGCKDNSHVQTETIPERELPGFWQAFEEAFVNRGKKFVSEEQVKEIASRTKTAILEEASHETYYSPSLLLAYIGSQSVSSVSVQLGLKSAASLQLNEDKNTKVYSSVEASFAGLVAAISHIANNDAAFDVYAVAKESALSCFTQGMTLAGSVSPQVLNGLSAALARGAFITDKKGGKASSKGRKGVVKAIARVLIESAGSEDISDAVRTIVKTVVENSSADDRDEILKDLADGLVEAIAENESLSAEAKSQLVEETVDDLVASVESSGESEAEIGTTITAIYEGLIEDLGSLENETLSATVKSSIIDSINAIEGLSEEEKSKLITEVESASSSASSQTDNSPDLASGSASGDLVTDGGAGTEADPKVATLDEEDTGSFTVEASSTSGYDFLPADFQCLGTPAFVNLQKDTPDNHMTIQANPGASDHGTYVFKCTVSEDSVLSEQFWIKLIVKKTNNQPVLSFAGASGDASAAGGSGLLADPYLITIEDGLTGNLTLTASDSDVYDFTSSDLSCSALPGWITPNYDSPDESIVLALAPTATGSSSFSCSATDGSATSDAVHFQVNIAATSPADINLQLGGTNVASGGSYQFPLHFINVGTAKSKQVTVQNLGSSDLTISSVGLSGTDAADFSLVNPPAASTVIAKGGAYSFTLEFEPSDATTPGKTAVLTVNSDDADEGAYTVNLSGTAAENICSTGSLDDPANPCVINTAVTLNDGDSITGAGSLTIDVGGSITSVRGKRISISMGGDVTVNGTLNANVTLTAANLTIGNTGVINANALGYALRTGPGYYADVRAGASHGGYGRYIYAKAPYGSPTEPTTFGSGSYYTSGGGAVKLIVSDTLEIASTGSVSANGSSSSTGGAGGSIWIQTSNFLGTGTISANGGSASGFGEGGGAGGRIAIYSNNHPKGVISADRGESVNSGHFTDKYHDGSVYIEISDADSICDTGNIAADCVINQHITLGGNQEDLNFANLSIAAGATLKLIDKGQTLNVTGDLTIDGILDTTSTTLNVGRHLVIGSSGSLTCDANHIYAAEITVGSDTTIDGVIRCNVKSFSTNTLAVAGSINADTYGYPNGYGPGYSADGGASHGGYGRHASAKVPYGDLYEPTSFGSGGQRKLGGGVIKIDIAGALTLTGSISAVAASDGNYRVGAGGSIWIKAGSFLGSGTIKADGGTSYLTDGSGAGGRIALYHLAGGFFAGTVSAASGTSGTAHPNGSDGTIIQRQSVHYALVTSSAFDGNFGGIAAANATCQSVADSAGLSGTWVALLSDSSTAAFNAIRIWGKVYNLNPTPEMVASSEDELWSGTLQAPIDYDESGTQISANHSVWSGTQRSGMSTINTCSDWGSNSSAVSGGTGDSNATTSGWVQAGSGTCDQQKRLYCISQ